MNITVKRLSKVKAHGTDTNSSNLAAQIETLSENNK